MKHWSRYYAYKIESDKVVGLKELIVYLGVPICNKSNRISQALSQRTIDLHA